MVILYEASDAVQSVYIRCFHSNHANSALQGNRLFHAMGMVRRQFEAACHEFTWNKWSLSQTVKSTAAQVLRDGFHGVQRTGLEKAHGPVQPGPDTRPPLLHRSGYRGRTCSVHLQVRRKLLNWLGRHRRSTMASKHFPGHQRAPRKGLLNSCHTNNLHQVSRFFPVRPYKGLSAKYVPNVLWVPGSSQS